MIGLPLGVLAASNVTRSPVLRNCAKAILNLLRSISELIWAVFFVAAVGLGPLDREATTLFEKAAVSYQAVLTKSDKLDAGDLGRAQAALAAELQSRPAAHPEVLSVSAPTGAGMAALRQSLVDLAVPPRLR